MRCDKCDNRLELREGRIVGNNVYCHDCWRKRENKKMNEDRYNVQHSCNYEELLEENIRLKNAMHSIHNYIANPQHGDLLEHIFNIDKMILNALYEEEGEGE